MTNKPRLLRTFAKSVSSLFLCAVIATSAFAKPKSDKKLAEEIQKADEHQLIDLGLHYFATEDSKGQTRFLLDVIKRAKKIGADKIPRDWNNLGIFETLAKEVLRNPEHRGHSEIYRAMLELPISSLAVHRLSKYPLKDVDRDAPEFRLIRALSKITDKEKRLKTLKAITKAPSPDTAEDIIKGYIEPDAPDGYTMERRFIGVGKTGEVSLIRRISDGKLYAWKVPVNDDPEHIGEMKDELEDAEGWRESGMTTMDVQMLKMPKNSWFSHSILKDYVPGRTLKSILEENPEFLDNLDNPIVGQLLALLNTSIKNKVFVEGLNADNFKYDGTNWHLIDGEEPKRRDSSERAQRDYQRELPEKWARFELKAHKHRFENFVKHLSPTGK